MLSNHYLLKCTEPMRGGNFTKDKLYEVINGVLIDDTGFAYYGKNDTDCLKIGMRTKFELVEILDKGKGENDMNNNGCFKAKCTSSWSDNFTVGKVYEVVNGVITADNCCKFKNNNDINCLNKNFYCNFELVTEECANSKFTLENIKPCMLVEFEDGDICMAMMTEGNRIELVDKDGSAIITLSNEKFDDNFKYKGDRDTVGADDYFDIRNVYGFTSKPHQALDFDTYSRPLLWERREAIPEAVKVYRPKYEDSFILAICVDNGTCSDEDVRIINITSGTIWQGGFATKKEAYKHILNQSGWECEPFNLKEV